MQTAPAVALTQREHDIVRLIDGGLSNKEIARHLHISDATVKNHIHNILAKLHVHRRTEATAWIRERAPKLPTVLCAIWLYSSFFV
jgi:DNA-binding NarL/FixJ family response regulator